MLRPIVFFALILAPAAVAGAQAHRPELPLPPGIAALTDGWRTQAGDNPAWAEPGFDDSAWQPAALSDSSPIAGGSRWYRLRLHLPVTQAPMALLVNAPAGAFEVWINGKRAPAFRFTSWLRMRDISEFVVPLGATGGEIQIALHVSLPQYLADTYSSPMTAYVGGAETIQTQAAALRDRRVFSYVPAALFNIALVVAGIGAFVLFWFQRAHREYFWLGAYLVLLGFETGIWLAVDFAAFPYSVNSLFSDPLTFPALICQVEFSFAFINRPVNRGWRAVEAAVFLSMFFAYAACFGWIPASPYWVIEAAASFTVGMGLLVLLLVQYRKGNREAGLLILPILLPAALEAVDDVGTVSRALGFQRVALFLENSTVSLGYVTFGLDANHGVVKINWVDMANIGFLLAIGAVLLVRFSRVSREQARAAAELEAAQRVQSLLLARAQSQYPGLRLDAVYRPAQEVGGDFFHTAQIAGATRVVIGDVSGKGMGAAMLVSVLLGALDGIRDLNPSAVLHHLNHIMIARQQGGFATCVCAALAPDGSITLANAGHLSPYRNGEEVPLQSGLPLGISPDIQYAETTLHLAPGDRLTFLSDGVVEAQSPTGELFGFARTAAISTQSAEAIAHAAQAHGQEDDITVLTLTFAPAEVLHA